MTVLTLAVNCPVLNLQIYCKQIAVLAAAKNTASSGVIAVDHYTGVSVAVDYVRFMYDGIDPNDLEEKIMAEKWYKVISKIVKK